MHHSEMSRSFWAASCLFAIRQRAGTVQARTSFIDRQQMFCMGGEL